MEYCYEQERLITIRITDAQFDEIINYAFGKKFSSLPSNITDESIVDGISSYITIYYSDNTNKKQVVQTQIMKLILNWLKC